MYSYSLEAGQKAGSDMDDSLIMASLRGNGAGGGAGTGGNALRHQMDDAPFSYGDQLQLLKSEKPGRLTRCWSRCCGTWRRGLCCLSCTGLGALAVLLPVILLVILPLIVDMFISATTMRVEHMDLIFQNGFYPVTTTLRIDNAGPVPVILKDFNATLEAPTGLQATTPAGDAWAVPAGFPMGWMNIPELDIAGNAPTVAKFHETIYPTNGTALGAAMTTLVLADSDKSLRPANWNIRISSTVVVLGFHVPVKLDKVLEWPPYPVDDWLKVCFNPPNCTWQ